MMLQEDDRNEFERIRLEVPVLRVRKDLEVVHSYHGLARKFINAICA